MYIITQYLLSVLIWLPIIGGCTIFFTKKNQFSKCIALLVSFIILILSIYLYFKFDQNYHTIQFIEHKEWFYLFDYKIIYYSLGVDGISVLFIILSSFTNLIIILNSLNNIKEQLGQYLSIMMITTGLTNGVFMAQDTILFYIFWEALLIPTTLGIGIWGGNNKISASIKYFFYNFVGSIFLLLIILYSEHQLVNLNINNGIFSFDNFITSINCISYETNSIFLLLLLGVLLCFAIKIPIWPFHSWLGDCHAESPIVGSIVLTFLMLKLGVYGLLRFILPIITFLPYHIEIYLIIITLISIIYMGLVAINQIDMKRIIAYSSISHMSLITLGIFSVDYLMCNDAKILLQGIIFQTIVHAFSSVGLLVCCGYLYLRMKSYNIYKFQLLASYMPKFSTFFMIFSLANIAIPGTSNFVGEFLIIVSLFKMSIIIALLAGLTLIISPVYILWMYKRVFFVEKNDFYHKKDLRNIQDISQYETMILSLLTIPILIFGIFPQSILNISSATSNHIINML